MSVEEFESYLQEQGYRKYKQDHKKSDYQWFKSFDVTYDEDGDKVVGYQIGVLMYDNSKYDEKFGKSLMFWAPLSVNDERWDLTYSPKEYSAEILKLFIDQVEELKIRSNGR